MTPDYVTTGIVSDWADHIEINDEDLILRQLQVFLCYTVNSEMLKVYRFMYVHVCMSFV